MKRLILFSTICSAVLASTALPQSAPTTSNQQIARAVKELQEQQAAIAQNQAKIEEKLAVVAEAVRQARIFASRGGAAKP